MIGVDTHPAPTASRPAFRGPLGGQRPRVISNRGVFGSDPVLLLAVAALVGLSVVMVFNISYFNGRERFGDAFLFFRKHLLAIGIGVLAAWGASRLSSEAYRRATYPVLGVVVAALLLVLVPGIGASHLGARRWLPVGPLTLQPSEFAKFAIVLYLARSLVKKGERLSSFKYGVVPHCLVVGMIAGLVLLEPDLGTATLAVGFLVFMLFVGGVPARLIAVPALAALPLAVWAVFTHSYQLKRILAFLSPDSDPLGINFQLQQSFIAFGSGGLWGVGLGESRQKMFYLPEAHTDFIFSVIGEELGLAGTAVVLVLFGVVAARGFRIALRHTDPFGRLLAFGVTLSLVLQGVVNMGVVLGCLPTKGLALPFLSYGGSAMIVVLAEIGVLLALAREAG